MNIICHHVLGMSVYRCYFLDARRYVVDNCLITCETDDVARAYADDLLYGSVYPMIEVWDGQRQVHEARKAPPR